MSNKVFEMVKLDKYSKRKISNNISFKREVDYVEYYPYRSVKVQDEFMTINLDTDIGMELRNGLADLFHADGDNHHGYGLFDKDKHPIMYILFEDQKILFGKSIMIID